jgi:hypothetical protein
VIAQALEYAAYVATLDHDSIRQVAERYLSDRKPPLSLEEAWQQAFGTGLEEVTFNAYQRIIVLTEGISERIEAVTKYLASQELDIYLYGYRYYQIEAGDKREEILEINQRIGPTGIGHHQISKPKYTEASAMAHWSAYGQTAYQAFRDTLNIDENQLIVEPKKVRISFSKQTRDKSVFIGYYQAFGETAEVRFRRDSLQDRLDVEAAIYAIQQHIEEDHQLRLDHDKNRIWYVIFFPATEKHAQNVADLILNHIVFHVK